MELDNINFTCQYFSVDDFNYTVNDDFLVFHQNIRSFNKNYDELSVFLDSLNPDIDVLVLTETWFGECSVTDIEGYNAFHSFRSTGRGGGVSIYVRNSIPSTNIASEHFVSDYVEYSSVKIKSHNQPLLYIVGIYRPPSASIDDFINFIADNFLSRSNNIQMILCGDMNVDLISPDNEANTLIDMFNSFSFYPLITLPTRVSNLSASCLDHIWYNNFNVNLSGIFKNDITDHYTIFMSLRFVIVHQMNRVSFRDHSERNVQDLRENIPVLSVIFQDARSRDCSVDELTNLFVNSLWNIYSKSCPVRNKIISVKRMSKPWIDRDLIRVINTKHRLFRQFKDGLIDFDIYRNYKNYLSTRLKSAKKNYYNNVFNTCRGNLRKTWNNINSTLKGKKNEGNVSLVDDDGIESSDNKHVADMFSKYFSSVATDLEKKIPDPVTNPMDYMGPIINESFYAHPSEPEEVLNLIMSLPNKSSNINSIPLFIYKIIAPELSILISELFNFSISSGVFPSCLKLSTIIPLHKSAEKCYVKNYRPISLIPLLSKIFEKLMVSRLNSFISRNNLISNNQFGFRAGRSTSDAALEFLNETIDAIDNRGYNIAIFLDLQKAFDTVNHGILIKKLERLGFRGIILEWFKSYLSGRSITVYVNKTLSEVRNISVGLPQGSVCSPILFLLYINDMCNVCGNLKCIQFADDTTLFSAGNSLIDLCADINATLVEIDKWLLANRLSLNINKTKYIIFTQNPRMFPEVILTIRGHQLEQVKSIKFLGIHIDENLKFKYHIDNICKKLSRSLGILYRMSQFVPPYILLVLYYSIFYPHLIYGIVVWGGCGVVSVGRVKTIHRRALKLLLSVFYCMDIGKNLLSFNQIFSYFVALKMFKCLKENNHTYFSNKFINLYPHHEHSTRSTHELQLNIPHYHKALSHNFFIYKGIKLWNSLPYNLKEVNCYCKFKNNLKNFIINSADIFI